MWSDWHAYPEFRGTIARGRVRMEFILRYRGPLPAKMTGTNQEKHRIRLQLHPQLEHLCQQMRVWQSYAANGLPIARLKNRRLDLSGTNPNDFIFRVPMRGVDFIPLVTRRRELACQLDIVWLRRERAGDILNSGGDLDNRLKSLFDGLRIPHEEKELPTGRIAPPVGPRIFCLLEDDALITKLTISTYQLLEPLEPGIAETDVDLLLRALVQSTSQQGAPEGFNYAE